MSSKHGWRVGDRVWVVPTGRYEDRTQATITEVDPPDLPRGVRLKLDRFVRGVDTCFASHDELTLITRAEVYVCSREDIFSPAAHRLGQGDA